MSNVEFMQANVSMQHMTFTIKIFRQMSRYDMTFQLFVARASGPSPCPAQQWVQSTQRPQQRDTSLTDDEGSATETTLNCGSSMFVCRNLAVCVLSWGR